MELGFRPLANDVDASFRPVWSVWYDGTTPEVSIVILNFNKSELTQKCLYDIWANTHGRRYETIVVDNGSTPREFRKLAEFPGQFNLIRLPKNRFYGEGNNIGVEASRGRYIVFLNNDAFVTNGWLEPLVSVLEHEENAGGVGPKLLYPDGRLQEAGAFIDEKGFAIQRGKFYPIDPSELNKTVIVDYCSTACFLTSREIFNFVSGFDATFEPAFYEDTDLCFKIACLGHFVYFCPQSKVYHIQHATSSDPSVKSVLTNVVDNNRHKFLARWGSYLASRTTNALPILTPPRKKNRKAPQSAQNVALFYTPYDLVPGGGERYILTAASALRETHHVIIATEEPYSSYRLDYLARELSIDLSGVSILTRRDVSRCGRIDLFLSLGNSALPSVPAHGKRNFFMCQFPCPSRDERLAARWENLKTYERVLVNSQFTRDALFARINAFQFEVPITILPPPAQTGRTENRSKHSERPIILSIGRFFGGRHDKRHDILLEGIRLLADQAVDCELHLVGTLHTHHLKHYQTLLQKAEGLPVAIHPNASPDVIADLLSRSAIYWHATGFGVDPKLSPEKCEHFGISVVEAMAAGSVPIVVSNGGPLEFVRERETGFQYSTIEELVAKTKALLDNPLARETISAAAVREAQRFSEETFVEKWRALLVSERHGEAALSAGADIARFWP
jgi:O-antigen biosynthesis protein